MSHDMNLGSEADGLRPEQVKQLANGALEIRGLTGSSPGFHYPLERNEGRNVVVKDQRVYSEDNKFRILQYRHPKGRMELVYTLSESEPPQQIPNERGEACELISNLTSVQVLDYAPPLKARVFLPITHGRAQAMAIRFVAQRWSQSPDGVPLARRFKNQGEAVRQLTAIFFNEGRNPDLVDVKPDTLKHIIEVQECEKVRRQNLALDKNENSSS